MSKRMKKLISMLLAMTMTITSVGVIALADEADTTAADAAQATPVATEDPDATPEPTDAAIDAPDTEDTATEAPTEAPAEEATPAPAAPVNDKYANDSYYQRALTLVTALGIFQGDENGNMNASSNVTRAEMAAIVLRMLNTAAVGPYRNGFNDVTAEHWAANEIQTAQNLGIINGFEDGSFRPSGDVTYEQLTKMVVCALGYEQQAQFNGGYPNGFIGQANSLELTDNANGIVGAPAERGLVIKMVYNALLTLYNEVISLDAAGYNVYKATRTLAKAKFDVIDENGVLTATSRKTIDQSYSELQDGRIVIDGRLYETELTGLEDYVGTEITYFYTEPAGAVTPIVVAVSTKKSSKTTKVKVNLDNVESLSGFEDGKGLIKMEKGSDYKCPDAIINYNGSVITVADYERATYGDKQGKFNKRNYLGEDLGEQMTFNEFLLPRQGTIELTDIDGDGKYDYVFVESYETMLVTSVSNKTVAGKIMNADRTFNVDTTANQDLKVTVMRNGDEVRPRNLNADDVASVMESLDGNTLKIVVSGESITGTVSSISELDDEYTAIIDGERYIVDANAISNIATGSEGTFYLDTFGRIGYATSTGGGRLSGNEKYGWIMNAYLDDDGDTYRVKIFTQDGKAETYEMASSVSFWGYGDTNSRSLGGSNRNEIVQMVSSDSFLPTGTISTPIRLCKFRVNASGLLNMLYVANEASDTNSNKAVVVDSTDLRGINSVGVTVGGHTISDGIVGFRVPQTAADMNTDSEYGVFSVTSTSFVSTTGVQSDFIVGEFTNDRDANVLIQFTTSSNSKPDVKDYGTVDDNPVMVVTGVDTGVDEDGEKVYYVVGRRNGAEVSYATTQNTLLVKDGIDSNTGAVAPFMSGTGQNATYTYEELWSANTNTDSIANYLTPGDVVGVKADSAGARILIKFVDVQALANLAAKGDATASDSIQYLGYFAASETRDGYGLGSVLSIDTSGDTYFNMGDQNGQSLSHSWYFPSATAIDLVEITTDENGYVSSKVSKESYEPSEMMNFNARNTEGDFVFSRNFRYNAQREAIVFRFNDN